MNPEETAVEIPDTLEGIRAWKNLPVLCACGGIATCLLSCPPHGCRLSIHRGTQNFACTTCRALAESATFLEPFVCSDNGAVVDWGITPYGP